METKYAIGDIVYLDHNSKEEAGIIESYGQGGTEMIYFIRIISNPLCKNMTTVKKESELHWNKVGSSKY